MKLLLTRGFKIPGSPDPREQELGCRAGGRSQGGGAKLARDFDFKRFAAEDPCKCGGLSKAYGAGCWEEMGVSIPEVPKPDNFYVLNPLPYFPLAYSSWP